ncbi:hypothetical protein ACFPC0_33275 [Streptomyces andamanensis]|uniref:Uncharacterized protein n=1 Tax=Streptomyces andamanensis TaxID=1565035 RepID=A0ABV8TQ22_9ACTN
MTAHSGPVRGQGPVLDEATWSARTVERDPVIQVDLDRFNRFNRFGLVVQVVGEKPSATTGSLPFDAARR